MSGRLGYIQYVGWWVAAWCCITVVSQIPGSYDANHRWSDIFRYGASDVTFEALCGVVWASFSWLLQWLVQFLLCLFPYWRPADEHDYEGYFWCRFVASVMLAVMEAICFGCPLGSLQKQDMERPLVVVDDPVAYSQFSVTVETTAIVLVFPFACLIAAWLAGRIKPKKVPLAPVTVASSAGVWPPPPDVGVDKQHHDGER